MLRALLCSLVICLFSTLSASEGLSQQYYPSLPTYSVPIQSYPVQSFPTQSYPVQGYPVQSFPTQSYPVQSYPTAQSSPSQNFSGHSPRVAANEILVHVDTSKVKNVTRTVDAYGNEHFVSKDYAYSGPGDMRTHLWKDHSSDLKSNGVSKDQLMAMPMSKVQKWHNFFHGTEGRPSQ